MRQGKKWQACRDVSDRFHTECGEIEEQHEGAGEHHAHEGCRKLWHEAGTERDDGERPKRDGERRSVNLTELSDDLQEARNDTTLGHRKAEDLAGLPEDEG